MQQYIPLIFPTICALIICALVISVIVKNEQINQIKGSLVKLKKSFNELDEQAKLIVKTDLELNKAQEESDKRLKGLEALHKTARLISTTLDEQEIFNRLDQSLQANFDFDKILLFIYDKNKILKTKIRVSYSQEGGEYALSSLEKNTALMKAIQEGTVFSSVNTPQQRKNSITQCFSTEHFVLSPILAQNGFFGILFVGNQSNASPVTEGDEEIISILANQIGQSLENARLFEEVFLSSQALETKVQDRTKQLEEALEEVRNISQKKSEFISAVSHELRTPLTSIKGYASILITGKLGEIPQAVKERLEKVNTHSDNLVKLINDLLDIARIESGRAEMNMVESDLNHVIENVHDLLTPQMKEKNIRWKTQVSPEISSIILDASQVERVFINLVGNAIKFTPENGEISINAVLMDSTVTVEVSDTGIGIAPKDITRLFDEFYRVENDINQNVKGTGLGLALAKKIVEAHQGKIWITSQINQGTTFHFTLPLTQTREEKSV